MESGLGDTAGVAVVPLQAPDLFETTLEWGRQWWDPEVSMLWNPDGAFPEMAAGRTLHQVPNTAWFAWSLLATGDPRDARSARDAIEALLELQHDAPGTPFDGTFRRFLEWPDPPDDPVMWEDYDPNWRQFVGTTFALILEDFGDLLGDGLGGRVLQACRRAALGEPDGRIPTSYTNPALMRAWLDAWVGTRTDDPGLLERGEGLARRMVERFDRHGTFDEFNSPTYYGIDLYALALWRTFGPTPVFWEQGRRLELAVWDEMLDLFSPSLGNWAGPYTRSYHPDATRSVAKAALWLWAEGGREWAPLPPLNPAVHHGHDLTSGPVIARLHRPVHAELERGLRRDLPRTVRATIDDREITAHLGGDLLLGAESSPHDWGGWDQFMPFVAHWRAGDAVEVLWLADPRQLTAELTPTSARLEVGGSERIELWLQAERCWAGAGVVDTGHRRIEIRPDTAVSAARVGDRWRVAIDATTATLQF